jgi:Family of unknown function (DUF6491)
MKTLSAIIVAAALTSACATTGDSLKRTRGEQLLSQYEPYVGEPVEHFTAFRYDSWQPISRTQLVLQTSINEAYLLTLLGTCPDLPYADTVRLTSTGSSVSTFDKVIVRGMSCPIEKIQPIDVAQMREDRKARAS